MDKKIAMPQAEVMIKQLTEAGIYGRTPQSDEFLRDFTNKIAGSEKFGRGIGLAWALAKYDVLRWLPPVVSVMMDVDFDVIIDVIVPDFQVAQDAKAYQRTVAQRVSS